MSRSETKAKIQNAIQFIYYKNGNLLAKLSPGDESEEAISYVARKCGGNEKTSFIFHGWTESCSTEWVGNLRERLTFYRGGCIICIDYSNWSKKPYLDLVQKFDIISHILYEEILELIRRGVDPANGYMFGFSYGGQLASKIGRQLIHYNDYMFKQIDMCDIAGPGFDFLSYAAHREAAENVACYYASLDKGTQFRSCHQNILLGHCGYTQPAILSQPYFSSHGLSVQIYINAFDYPFYASSKLPTWCLAGNPVLNLPEGFKVGYNGDIGSHIQGDIFVPTGLNYPYNLSKRQLKAYEKYFKET
ncbi:uncharacterized protein LOC101889484 [Musca domestica]|uniref:Uncharacterized protein LOC101889484 n=1 Tax=Musca domestica TaxID=7370 RepID=A0ABM3V8P0_MUSDO|nr:uncharacterized protein LOC101889484 [Musca domestica]